MGDAEVALAGPFFFVAPSLHCSSPHRLASSRLQIPLSACFPASNLAIAALPRTPGVTVMSQLILALALFAAEPPAAPDNRTVAEKLDKIEQSMKSISEQNLQMVRLLGETMQKDVNDINRRIDGLQRDIEILKQN